ncbi:multicomponent Na+:H+ antiporter subunit F [Fervidobacterium changbaicum]|uniref:PH regulation protein F n=1 Tax=Fervidobacterium changbaicum TaxID=310769 RepID=A0ABX5QTC1_9BACT|nr:cation:proton antiporter [Fervidobacterium changbaicum]QAV33619.1 pH regulation protein F [Fervidobacterium changbaicum]SDH72001.1 multicomponent Na+:H+ antiporter subunit F [Fervidobacterium changbaicum]
MSGSLLIDLIVFGLTGLGIFFSLLRFLLGPSSFERLMAVDMMNVMVIGLVSLIAYIFKNNMYMDIAILYGLLSFIETIVFARYLENQAVNNAESKSVDGDVK